MPKYCGRLFILAIETTPGGGTFTTIGPTQSNGMTINNEQVDVTTKGDAPARQLINCGINSMSLSGSGFVTDDSALEQLKVASHSGEILNFRITSDLGDQYEGPFQVSSFERTGEHNNAETFSVSLESAAAITYTAPA